MTDDENDPDRAVILATEEGRPAGCYSLATVARRLGCTRADVVEAIRTGEPVGRFFADFAMPG